MYYHSRGLLACTLGFAFLQEVIKGLIYLPVLKIPSDRQVNELLNLYWNKYMETM